MNRFGKTALLFAIALMTLPSCKGRRVVSINTVGTGYTANSAYVFNADSAYSFIAAQTAFGPRVPGTRSQLDCRDWLVNTLKRLGAEVSVHTFDCQTFDKKNLKGYNVIGKINPELGDRIMLCSHWDSRPWADNDSNKKNWTKPIDGANDGASGVGVILEIFRILASNPHVGIDCVFFDIEDWGPGPDFEEEDSKKLYWCLGSQAWSYMARNNGYKARYAVLLDMVGASDATFYKEGVSMKYAASVVDKYWKAAADMGYGKVFVNKDGGAVTDDHYPVNAITGIPAIDIIPYSQSLLGSSFGSTWHTLDDNLQHIDRATLNAVGTVLTNVLLKDFE